MIKGNRTQSYGTRPADPGHGSLLAAIAIVACLLFLVWVGYLLGRYTIP